MMSGDAFDASPANHARRREHAALREQDSQ